MAAAGTGNTPAAHRDAIRAHFDGIAPRYPAFKARNRYYHRFLTRWVRAMTPPGRRVLDLGCGRGEILAAARPATGVGIDVSPAMIDHARRDFPGLEFRVEPIETPTREAPFDTVLAVNLLEYTADVGRVLERAHAALRDNGRLLVVTANPVWSPMFAMASAAGLRVPDCRRLFITNRDLMNLLELHGFDVVYEQVHLAIPKWIPLLSGAINFIVSRIPGLRLIGSTQLVVARKTPPARREYSVSVVVPCLNERDNIQRCLRAIPRLGASTEAVVVDDGSTDGTADQVTPGVNPEIDVSLVRFPKNQGKGQAVAAGFAAARGDIVIILDADLTTDPVEFHPLYEAFATGRAEFVNGTRFVYPMEGRAMKWANYMGNRLFTILVSAIMERRVSDTLCGTKALFRDDALEIPMGRDPWGDYDLLFGAAQRRLVLRELPVHYRERRVGRSKMRSLAHGLRLIRVCWSGLIQVKGLRPLPGRQASSP